MTDTNKYYEDHAEEFYQSTVEVDMSPIYQRFLPLIPEGGAILDAGCGSGRDSLYFKTNGYEVTAMDASEALCKLSGELLVQDVHCMGFEDMAWEDSFDGVWACASLLHVSRDNLPSIMNKFSRSLKAGGVLYASFKYGDTEREQGGRAFTDMNEELFDQLLKSTPSLELIESWVTVDRRVDRDESWLNVVVANS
ncbi:class I SAM-dependent methyltransferase [Oceanicoccus sagamiensis]|uniref:SAM-dependent methyltransferase n=1 Tax=Oceanicoccus sagamiensis TaxID=716816 RepID=A0A1X9NA13_9GAMM|nr:class I SAM-dependent methyltransferase [Oceanicoccus sagamiensis]ARN74890.1 SAM-dependent methyltransferase [Oceanicoccus sagamiensis]